MSVCPSIYPSVCLTSQSSTKTAKYRIMQTTLHDSPGTLVFFIPKTLAEIPMGSSPMKLGMQVGLGRGHIVIDGDPAPLPQKGTAPNFQPISVVAKWLGGLRCHLVWRLANVRCGQMVGWTKMHLVWR